MELFLLFLLLQITTVLNDYFLDGNFGLVEHSLKTASDSSKIVNRHLTFFSHDFGCSRHHITHLFLARSIFFLERFKLLFVSIREICSLLSEDLLNLGAILFNINLILMYIKSVLLR